MTRKKILCLTSHYLPGFKSGGPLRSLLHMQEWLDDDFEFAIVTRNRDAGEDVPYEGLERGGCRSVHDISVWYLAAPYWRPGPIRTAVAAFRPDALYCHSSLDVSLTIMPLILRRLGWLARDTPVIVAPRGELSAGARSIKSGKKKVYFFFARLLGIYRNVIWHATNEEEERQIRTLWGTDVSVVVAPNLPAKLAAREPAARQGTAPGSLRLVFLSRLSPKKNLHGALEILKSVTVPVHLDIYGTTEDPAYWAQCQDLIAKLPGNIGATYKGPLLPEAVIPTLSTYDAFFFPTLGENFGHVIYEALLAGCPVILSDQTPWRQLEAARVGFDIPLSRPDLFHKAIERLSAMDSHEHRIWSDSARACGERYSNDPDLVNKTRVMLALATT